jgi:hypothetical protein
MKKNHRSEAVSMGNSFPGAGHTQHIRSFTPAAARIMFCAMTNRPPRINALAVRVCQAIRDVRQEHESWISIDRVHDRLAVEDLRSVEAAVAFASAKGWLAVGGQPAASVLLNREAP